ncbi:MAG: hypothetical protein K8R50_10480 [Betaproteobacteria bacterium]|nr:hypothetical protein [Betaproteobacteria bacterium]MCX7195637.1 hypothetical protein [Pseudomonadota bacterium]
MIEVSIFHEDAFYEYFEPYRHSESHHDIWGGIGLETFGNDLEIVRQHNPAYVWTVVDGDKGCDQWITPGMQHVNRVCYLITRLSHQWIDVDFHISHRAHFLTPIGLLRQINRLKHLTAN